MYHWLLASAIYYKPHRPVQSPGIVSTLFGSGLASTLLVLVSLALLAGIIAVIWMFATGRWQSARSLGAAASPSGDWPPGAAFVGAGGVTASIPQPQMGAGSYLLDHPAAPNTVSPPVTLLDESDKPPLPQSRSEDRLKNTRWLRLVVDCAELFDELDKLFSSLDPPRQEIARHIKYRLQEILNRSGVESISRDRTFDENRHQLEQQDSTAAPGTPIVKFVSPGFAVDGRILRRATVQVADTSTGR